MNKKKLIKGDSIFKNVVGNNGYFVDKTMLIKEFIDNGDKVLLIPRPRRFGKTMNLSMLEYFFDITKKEYARLFSEFKINNEKETLQEHQNQYPVINISLKSIKAMGWDNCLRHLKKEISELYREHKYLLKSDKLDDIEKRNIEKIISEEGTQDSYEYSLKNLSGYLKTHHQKDVIILLDEYDTPIISGYKKGYYSQIIDFMQTFMGQAFKDNKSLHKGLITGIMRVARESIFSEMNNLGIYTILSHQFADKFGFTEEEARKIADYYISNNDFSEIKKWYDGYKFGLENDMYNPWSIVNYISNHTEGFEGYWVRSGTDDLINKFFIKPENTGLRNDLQDLLEGKIIKKEIEKEFIFPNLDKSKNLLWSLLLFAGYLKPVNKVDPSNDSDNYYQLTIPNREVKQVYKSIVKYYFDETISFEHADLRTMLEHLTENRISKFKKMFQDFVYKLSYHDFAGENAEQVYHAFVLGILIYLQNSYTIYSNIESGEGRPDILLIPNNKSKYGIIIELKKTDKDADEDKIKAKTKEAFEQIAKNNYAQKITEQGIKEYVEIAMVFSGKKVFVDEKMN